MQHITIIGGGIGGLCLAQGLKKANLNFIVQQPDVQDGKQDMVQDMQCGSACQKNDVCEQLERIN